MLYNGLIVWGVLWGMLWTVFLIVNIRVVKYLIAYSKDKTVCMVLFVYGCFAISHGRIVSWGSASWHNAISILVKRIKRLFYVQNTFTQIDAQAHCPSNCLSTIWYFNNYISNSSAGFNLFKCYSEAYRGGY